MTPESRNTTGSMEVKPRTRRSRVLLIGGGSDIERLAHELGDRAVHATNRFVAVGEIATASAQEPIELVVLAQSAVQDGPSPGREHPAQAIRKIDPATRVFLVRDRHNGERARADDLLEDRDEAEFWSYDEFDAVLQHWPSRDDLNRLLADRDEGVGSTDQETAQRTEQRVQSEPRSAVAERRAAEPEPHKPGSAHNAERTAEGEHRTAPTKLPPPSQISLGDVDLVEAIMSERGVRETALQLMRQHTGFNDITLDESAKDDSANSDLHSEPVRFGEQTLGVLRSNSAPPHVLQGWARWLARWLAMDEQYQRYRNLSLRDDLTGAYNRRYFMTFLTETIKQAGKMRLPVSVMVFDLDDFKRYNDEYGHAAGDEILRETVRLLNSVIRKSDRVCRIGGDEFAVIFADPGGPRERGSAPPETVEQLAQRFQDQVCRMNFPKLGIEAPGTLSVSAGLATFPWDGWEPEAILRHADELALQSKRKGKNAITLGQGARQARNSQ